MAWTRDQLTGERSSRVMEGIIGRRVLSDVFILFYYLGISIMGGYHESVTNVRYAAVSLTKVRQEWCFALSKFPDISLIFP